jgi:hypothetical protein
MNIPKGGENIWDTVDTAAVMATAVVTAAAALY